jgi:site-specific recombinase XerD
VRLQPSQRQTATCKNRSHVGWDCAEDVGIENVKAHPHMLRHACGYALANKGHDTRSLQAYLGHKNIQHTVRYTELSPTRFKDFWRGEANCVPEPLQTENDVKSST